MVENWFWKEVTAGITIGLTVAVIAGLFKLSMKVYRRQHQKKRIRKIIHARIKKIRETEDLKHPDGKTILPADQLIGATYARLRHDIFTELAHKSSEISFDDEQKIVEPFFIIDQIFKGQALSLEIFESYILLELKKVKWLKLK